MEVKVVYEGKSKKGKHFIVRYPTIEDAKDMRDYLNELSKEQTFITYQGEQVTLEEETAYLKRQLQRIQNNKAVQLLVFCGQKLTGISGVDLLERTSAHQGNFGISISEDFRGEGIGRVLMEKTIEEAKKNLKGLRLITLGLFACNTSAKGMYEKFGFKEYGSLPGGVLYKGEYIDHVFMYKNV